MQESCTINRGIEYDVSKESVATLQQYQSCRQDIGIICVSDTVQAGVYHI